VFSPAVNGWDQRLPSDILPVNQGQPNSSLGERNVVVTSFQKQVGVPVVSAAIVAAGIMMIDGRFGPPPLVLPFKYGAVVVHIPWLLALLPIGAGATFLARRAGANLSRCLVVTLSPALLIGGAVNLLMALVVTTASISGHRVYPIDFVGHFIVGWLVVPAMALLFGSLPFLRDEVPAKGTRA
jgi:hypothetical protein